jgi:hypothetical protein
MWMLAKSQGSQLPQSMLECSYIVCDSRQCSQNPLCFGDVFLSYSVSTSSTIQTWRSCVAHANPITDIWIDHFEEIDSVPRRRLGEGDGRHCDDCRKVVFCDGCDCQSGTILCSRPAVAIRSADLDVEAAVEAVQPLRPLRCRLAWPNCMCRLFLQPGNHMEQTSDIHFEMAMLLGSIHRRLGCLYRRRCCPG